MRKIKRQINESVRDGARQIAKTSGYARSRRQRTKVEVLYEFLMAATAQNLRRMAMWLGPKGTGKENPVLV